ncbi:interferon-inducible protein AIM2 [Ctenodactylus gundi]
MDSKYKEILLLTGLDNITDEELDRFKFFLPDEFKIARGQVEAAKRTELAHLMIQSAGAVAAVVKAISIFHKLNYLYVARSLQEEKDKVDALYVKNKKKERTKLVKKESQVETSPGASAASRNDAVKQQAVPEVSSQSKTVVRQIPSQKSGLQRGCLTVMVLKAIKPFTFETQGREEQMFHATVATEMAFFFVKVFNVQLQDKFTPKRIIIISKYSWHSGFLEVDGASSVSDAGSDQKITVPQNIIRKAGKTPKINKLQTQPVGTVVHGMFAIQMKTELSDGISLVLYDNTGTMEVLVFGKQSRIKCGKGDKLRLTFFELSKSGEELQLKSGLHSFITVIKNKKKSEMKKIN